MITLEEAKEYLRVDGTDEDTTITSLLNAAKNFCCDVARLDEEEFFSAGEISKMAVLFTLGYFFEHREEANHHELALRLRSLLGGIRKVEF